ncbi:hypothetical protein ACHAXS_010114 [Conticribra weissflogii]
MFIVLGKEGNQRTFSKIPLKRLKISLKRISFFPEKNCG